MNNPRNLFYAVALTLLLGLSTTAVSQVGSGCEPGQILTPCASMTGQTSTPPGDMGTPTEIVPGQIETPPTARDASFTEIAADVLLGMMSLF